MTVIFEYVGAKPPGPVVIFDDDQYYMGAVIAEALRLDGLDVALVTPGVRVSAWSEYTTEQERTHVRLLELDVDVVTAQALDGFDGEGVDLACIYTGRTSRRAADGSGDVVEKLKGSRLNVSRQPRIGPASNESAGFSSQRR